MKTVLFLAFIGLILFVTGNLQYRNNYPYADYAIVQPSTNSVPRDNIVFSFQDTQASYKINVDNVAYNPDTQEAFLGGIVAESSDPTLPNGAYAYIYVQGTEDFWQNFPSLQTSSENNEI